MAKRLLAGLEPRTKTLATELFEGINFKGDFLKQKVTRNLFSVEQSLPSAVIDRDSVRGWQAAGSLDTFARAKERTRSLLAEYKRPALDPVLEQELQTHITRNANNAGMEKLPEVA